MLSDATRREAADALAKAESNRAPIARLTETYPTIEVEDAYEIQRLQIADKLRDGQRAHVVSTPAAASAAR